MTRVDTQSRVRENERGPVTRSLREERENVVVKKGQMT